jgi:hypothetical protein
MRAWGVLLLLGLALLAAAPPAAHGATDEHIFDATLSLMGRCDTDSLDTVPDPWCPGPPGPSKPFESPNVAIDAYGDIYVASLTGEGTDGRIYVFSPEGEFLTEFAAEGPRDLAVDAQGNLYVYEFVPGKVGQVSRFSPSTYDPDAGKIAYTKPPVVVVAENTPEFGYIGAGWSGLAIDPSSGKLFVSTAGNVGEWSSAEEGNKLLNPAIGKGVLTSNSKRLAVDAAGNRLLVTDSKAEADTSFVQVFELKAPHKFLGIINGSKTPIGKFLSDVGFLSIDVDEVTGNIFISDVYGKRPVYEFGPGLGEDEKLIEEYKHSFEYVTGGGVAVDNGPESPNRGTLFVPSAGKPFDHVYAFRYVIVDPAVVESVSFSGVTEDEAVLRATINPEGAATEYRIEYTSLQSFEEAGFTNATVAAEGTLPSGLEGKEISAAIAGLDPDSRYRFRVVAVNEEGEGEAEAGFRTYPSSSFEPCPNEAARTGFSAQLPDCRAYELVTPPNTNGRSPLGPGEVGIYFPTLLTSSDGTKFTFRVEGGTLPGSEGSGTLNGENYLSTRGPSGWSTEIAAPSGTDAITPQPGSVSPDQEHSFWGGEIEGELAAAPYIRYPDGRSELVGRGSLGTDLNVDANLITEGGSHIIFTTVNAGGHAAMQLEEAAPPDGTTAVYDRTSDEVTHVVSLLPGDVTPAAGQNASYVGASPDGEGIAFEINGTLYLRHGNEETYEVGKGVTFAGIAEGGTRIFYLEGGDLLALDVEAEETIAFSESGDVTAVNVSTDGTAAYYLSPSVLTAEENPNGATAQAGEENLYLSREGAVSFVGTVTALDVAGKPLFNDQVLGLGQWTKSLETDRPGIATSRTTPDGSVLLFQSRAALAGYDPKGHVQIYRYDSVDGVLSCLSCNPTEAPASSDASLQMIPELGGRANPPLSAFTKIPNLRPDGDRAFFQSYEALVKSDTNGVQDVYEWEAEGVGSCQRPGGCIYLISSGQSARDNHLFAIDEQGENVFFLTSDILLSSDLDETPSIYDARVNGGFPELPPVLCQGEGCRPPMTAPPAVSAPANPPLGPSDNVKNKTKPRKCAKGKRKVVRQGKTRCVKKHRKNQPKSGKNGGRGK